MVKKILKAILPESILTKLRSNLEYLKAWFFVKLPKMNADRSQVFSEIYLNKQWGGDGDSDFFSGPGSTIEYTAEYQNLLSNFIVSI